MTKTKKSVLIFLVLAAVIFFIIYEFVSKNEGEAKRNSDIKISYDTGVKADFYTYNKNIFYLTKDGLQMINQKGEGIWSDTFNMASPSMITDGNIAAVLEKDGKNVKVYNEKGPLSSINTDNAIASASVNIKGDVCVISKGDTYYLSVYSQSGEKIFDGNFASDDGLPVCSDISDDGKILAVSFLDITDIKVKSRVCFYYIGENSGADQDADSDYMFASYIEDDAVVGVLSFMEGNSLAALSDKSLSLMSLNPTANEKYRQNLKYDFSNRVNAADLSNKKIISIAFGEASLNSQNPLKENTVKWFNHKGNETGTYEAEKDISGLKTSDNATIISMGRQFAAADSKGSLIWEYKAIQDIKDMFFLSSSDNVLLVGTREAYSVNINGKVNAENLSDENDDKENNLSDNKQEQTGEENSEEITEGLNSSAEKQTEENISDNSLENGETAAEKQTEEAE